MSTLLIKAFWISLLIFLSISFVFLGTIGIPVTQSLVIKTIPKEKWSSSLGASIQDTKIEKVY